VSDNRILYYDPNRPDNKGVPLEDLSISVELTATKKSRSVIVNNVLVPIASSNGGVTSETVNFISGSRLSTSPEIQPSLTTRYTNIGSGEDNLEGFGITDINIDFNTAYAPVIKINFVDVRGGMMSRGNESKYRIFFDLPYPLFNLTVKGYYGKAVSYCLHMVKWNSLFNSSTGNYEIEAEFIGYTYAMLTDILVGYMKAIPYTEIGGKMFSDIRNEFSDTLGVNILTMDELIQKTEQAKELVEKYSPDTEEYKKLISLKAANKVLSEIEALRVDLVRGIEKEIGGSIKKPTYGVLDVDTIIYPDIQDNKTKINKLIKAYKNGLDNKLTELEQYITDFDRSGFKDIEINNIKLKEFIDKNDLSEKKKYLTEKSSNGYDLNDKDDSNRLSVLSRMLTDMTDHKGNTNLNVTIHDFIRTEKKIRDIYNINEKINVEEKNKLSNVLREKSKNILDFDPTINTIFLTLCAHAEAFMESVAFVAEETDGNTERTDELQKLLDNNSGFNIDNNLVKSGVIYPFPEYHLKGVETWMGDDVDTNSVPELKFTKDLLNGLIESKRNELEALELNYVRQDWYAMSPAETPLMGVNTNPYRGVTKLKHPDELLRILMYRSFLHLALYKPEIDMQEIEVMGVFEGLNLFYGNADGRSYGGSDTIRTLLNEFFKDSDNIINHFLEGSNNVQNFLIKAEGDAPKTPYIKFVSGDRYEYSYITEFKNGKLRQYIPITDDGANNSLNGKNFGDISGSLRSNDEVKNISSLFISNAINNPGVDDGSRFIKILPLNRFENSGFSKPTDREFDTELYDKNHDKFKVTYPTEALVKASGEKPSGEIGNIKHDFIRGKFGTSEFIGYSDSENDDVRKSFFVDNVPKSGENERGTTVKTVGGDKTVGKTFYSVLKNDSESYIDNPSFTYSYRKGAGKTENISLFGSPMYHAQNKTESKAYLFLSTLPIAGMYGEGSSDGNTVFNNKDTSTLAGLFTGNGGLIKTPAVWVYWVGSLLWRYYEATDPITKLPVGYNSIPGVNQFPNKGELFHSISKIGYPQKEISCGFKLLEDDFHKEFKKVDITLINLPIQVRNEFINQFKTFANSSRFRDIDESLTIFLPAFNITDFTLNQTTFTPTINRAISKGIDMEYFTGSTFNPSQITSNSNDNYNIYHIRFDMNNPIGRSKANDIFKLMTESVIIVNSTPRIFKKNVSERLSIPEAKLKTYLKSVADTYRYLYDKTEEKLKDEKKIISSVFGNDNNKTVLLNIYRHLTAVNDKWIGGNNRQNGIFYPCKFNENDRKYRGDGGKNRLFDSFKFMNKAFVDIGNDFLINPEAVSELIKGKYNQSFFDLISRILSGNNMDFIPLPTFVDFKTVEGMADIFRPITYNKMVSDSENMTVGPSFVCVYVGQHSTSLDVKNGNYPNDGANLKDESTLFCPDWTTDRTRPGEHKMNIPVFEVNYAQQNQSYFKDYKPDQREFVETQESLEIIDSLSRTGDKNDITLVGQNLFNIYQKRSYSVEVEAMGMPLIQPMMYFQLNDVPMFRGAYLIINTKHNIKPNHMTTKFKGVRVKNTCTPLMQEFYLIKDLKLDLELEGGGSKYDLILPERLTDEKVAGRSGSGRGTVTSKNPDVQCGMASANNVDNIYRRSTHRGGTIAPKITIVNRPEISINKNGLSEVSFSKTIVTPSEYIRDVESLINKLAPNTSKALKKKVLISAFAIGRKEQPGPNGGFKGFNNNLTGVESSGFKVFDQNDVNGKVGLNEGGTGIFKFYYSFTSIGAGLVPVISSIMNRNLYAEQDGDAGANEWAWRWFRDWNGYGNRTVPEYSTNDSFDDCTIIRSAEDAYKKAVVEVNKHTTFK